MEDLSREKMACKQLDEDTCPSVCFCTVNQEATNINLKSNGHVHCPCEVCTGEPVYPTTAWRHLQRSKKAKFSNNEVQDEVDCCFTAEPVNIESRTGESVDKGPTGCHLIKNRQGSGPQKGVLGWKAVVFGWHEKRIYIL